MRKRFLHLQHHQRFKTRFQIRRFSQNSNRKLKRQKIRSPAE